MKRKRFSEEQIIATRRNLALAAARPTIQQVLDACNDAINLHDASVAVNWTLRATLSKRPCRCVRGWSITGSVMPCFQRPIYIGATPTYWPFRAISATHDRNCAAGINSRLRNRLDVIRTGTRVQGDLAALDWHFIASAQSNRANTAP